VLLVDRDGFDYQSVADVLDAQGTVCSRLSRRARALVTRRRAQVVPDAAAGSIVSRERGRHADVPNAIWS
jgi:hypothetical protein